MQANFKYVVCIVEFINHIIKYFFSPKNKIQMPESEILLVLFNKLNLSFALKLDVNLNTKYQIFWLIYNIIYYKYKSIIIN